MLAAFTDCGCVKAGAMGSVPLEWGDVLAFADGTAQIERGPDVSLLFHMCRAYHSAHHAAQVDALTIAPADRAGS